MFKTATGIEMTHVPYKGSAPALADVIGGHISLLFTDPAPALPLVKAGKARALGVTSAARLPSAPDILPLAEAGVPGFDATGWGMLVAPAHTPTPIVTKLYDAFRSVAARAEVRDRLILLGLAPQTSPPPNTLQAFIDDEMVRAGGKLCAPRVSPAPSDRSWLSRSVVNQRGNDFIPLRCELLDRWFAARLAIPISGIVQIALDAMQISVDPGAILALPVHDDPMRFVPVAACRPPQGL
jgi:hypothetical protein